MSRALVATLLLSALLCGVAPPARAELYPVPMHASIESYNFPGLYVRHRNYLVDLTPTGSLLDRQDATWRVVPGLAGAGWSFQSLNHPGFYARHENFRLKLQKFDQTTRFRRDATFMPRRGLAGFSTHSYESYNLPGYFMRHKNYELSIAPPDGTDLFRRDATFVLRSALASTTSP